MRLRDFFFLLFILFGNSVYSQLNFIFLPEINGKSIDGLSVFRIQNLTGKAQAGTVYIDVKENVNKLNIVTISTQAIIISTGVYSFPRTNFVNSQLQFSNNAFSSIVSQTRFFPPGEYSFCYRFIPADKSILDKYEDCFDGNIEPMLPISLLNPADKDTICQKRPFLTWQPPLPFNASMRFRLLLTEKKAGIESIENLLTNVPLVFLDNIPTTSTNYPATSPELKEGKTYCWQVIAFQNGLLISKSEIWDFTVQCSEQAPIKPNDSYRELKSLVNGNYYVANKYLKFSFSNNYNIKALNYSIHDIENSQKPVKNLPTVNIVSGHNKIDIDITDLGLVSGKFYLLKVYPFNEPLIEVRFIYQENSVLDK